MKRRIDVSARQHHYRPSLGLHLAGQHRRERNRAAWFHH
jgi:hypothetical protein